MLSLTSLSGELCMRSDTQETCTPKKPDIIRKTLPLWQTSADETGRLPLSALALGCCQTVYYQVWVPQNLAAVIPSGGSWTVQKSGILQVEVAFAQEEQCLDIAFKPCS